jgi:hypothetical protein
LDAVGSRVMDEKKAVRDFLGERPDAAQWRQWRETLVERLRRLRAQQAAAPAEARPELDARIAELKKQIAALEQEELVTEFIEDSVRVTLAMGSAAGDELEDSG